MNPDTPTAAEAEQSIATAERYIARLRGAAAGADAYLRPLEAMRLMPADRLRRPDRRGMEMTRQELRDVFKRLLRAAPWVHKRRIGAAECIYLPDWRRACDFAAALTDAADPFELLERYSAQVQARMAAERVRKMEAGEPRRAAPARQN